MEDDLEKVPAIEVFRRAENGDSAAQAAVKGLGAEIAKIGRAFDGSLRLPSGPAIDISAAAEVSASIAAEKREAVEREEAMLREMAAMRQAVERAEDRADAAEGREREALDLARRNYRVAVVAAIVTVLSLAATVLVAVLV